MPLTLLLMCGLDITVQHFKNTTKGYCSYIFMKIKVFTWAAELTPVTPILRLFATVAKKNILYCKTDLCCFDQYIFVVYFAR